MDGEGELSLLALLTADAEEPFADEDHAALLRRLANAVGRLEPRQRAVVVATEFAPKNPSGNFPKRGGSPLAPCFPAKAAHCKTCGACWRKAAKTNDID